MHDDEMQQLPRGLEEESPAYSGVRRFEDLFAWQRARELTAAVYTIGKSTGLKNDRGLREQMQRASVSIISNIAEGHERGSTREYHRFLSIAKGSCAELRAQVYVASGVGYIDQATFSQLLNRTERLGQLIGALRMSIARHLES
jgi:four helix bundle protein